MKRIPAKFRKAGEFPKTAAERTIPLASNGGSVRSGKPVMRKAALGFGGAGFGMGLGNAFNPGASSVSAYQSAYGSMGLGMAGTIGDMPQFFAMLNENNGGMFYWPVSMKERYSWFRFFARADPLVKRAVAFHTDLPMSRLILRMPKMGDERRRDMIKAKYEAMVKKIKLFDRLHSVLYELNVLGNAFCWCEYDEKSKEWGKLCILPPEEITVSKCPMSDNSLVMYQPEIANAVVQRNDIPLGSEEEYAAFVKGLPESERAVFSGLTYDFVRQLVENDGKLPMDTDPFCGADGHKVGSFVYHFSENRHDYYDLGTSPLECLIIPLLMKEYYKHTQLSLASRNMTPRNKIVAPEVGEETIELLRHEVDMSMLDPDYSIITNYEWTWEQIGADNRLIDLSREYENINEQLYAGLGLTKECITGEAMYSGSKINVELMNTMYMLRREQLSDFVEQALFLPMAEENGFYETDEWGNKKYLYPKLSFARLSIRDNEAVFDSLFQLYQKGSLPIDVILDLFNIDSDEVHDKLKSDMFTVKDAAYNEMLRNIYSSVSDTVSKDTNLADLIIKYITGPDGEKLKKKREGEEALDYADETGPGSLKDDEAGGAGGVSEDSPGNGEGGGESEGAENPEDLVPDMGTVRIDDGNVSEMERDGGEPDVGELTGN